jgi:diaminopimelate epimerase
VDGRARASLGLVSSIPFRKGHGTENDFVLLPDPDASLDLTPARVRALCDRRAGVGADGVLRVVRAKAVPDRPSDVDDDVWFMDYRNADGSVAEMCGNGARLFAAHLVETGLVDGAEFTIGTRGGAKAVRVAGGAITIGMGVPRVTGTSTATLGATTYPGTAVDVGNPHLVCEVDQVVGLNLTTQPGYDAAVFPDGVNVEFVEVAAADRLRMRVHERGVGETRSCGTGTVATVTAVLHARGAATGAADVDVLGGRVRVVIADDGATLTGPAVFVAAGELDERWWQALDQGIAE